MYKKGFAVFLALYLLLFQINGCAESFSDMKDGKHSKAINSLAALKIMNGYGDGTFRPKGNISRADFAFMVASVKGISNYAASDVRFSDVDEEYWAAEVIHYVTDTRLMSGYDDGSFKPDENITYIDAICALVKLVGYDSIARNEGGYPQGYLLIAAKIGILNNVEIEYKENAKRAQIAQIMYNALKVNLLVSEYNGQGSLSVSNESLYDKLVNKQNIAISHGIITATSKTRLSRASDLPKGTVEINNIVYKVGNTHAEDYLGQNVEYYLKDDEETGDRVLLSVRPYENDIIEIDADNIIAVSSNQIKYDTKDDEMEEVDLAANLKLIYNGKAVETFNIGDIKPARGYLRLIDNNNDGDYDVIFENEYQSMVVDKVAKNMKAIYFKNDRYNGFNNIRLDSSDTDFEYFLQDRDGNDVMLDNIKEDDVVTVTADYDRQTVSVTVYTQTVNGTVTELDMFENEVWIDGEIHKIAKDYNGNLKVNIKVGDKKDFLLDRYGWVVGTVDNESKINKYACVIKKSLLSGVKGTAKFKVIYGGNIVKTSEEDDDITYDVGNSDLKTIKITEDTTLNDKKFSPKEIYEEIHEGDLISFDTGTDGKITDLKLLTPYVSSDDRAFNSKIKAFGGKFYIDEKTSVILLPKHAAENDDDYYVKLELNKSTKYNIASYDVDDETKIAKAVMIISTMDSDKPGLITDNTPLTIVNKITKSMDEEGEQVYVISGYSDGKEIKLSVRADAELNKRVARISAGSLIYYSTNAQGKIDDIDYVNDISPISSFVPSGQPNDSDQQIFGTLYNIQKEVLYELKNDTVNEFIVSAKGDGTDNVFFRVPVDDMPPIYLYNTDRNRISMLTIDDMLSYRDFKRDASKIYICMKHDLYKGVIIVK